MLSHIDYHGWVTAEVRGGDRQRLTEIGQQMDQIFDRYERVLKFN